MRYIKFYGGNGYSGCDFEEVLEYPDKTCDVFLDLELEEMISENAESYEYLVTRWEEEDIDLEEIREDYSADCWGNWQEISKEEYKEYTE